METETPIAEGIRATDGNAQYDAACKRLLAFKIILAWIMKSCLEEYKYCDVNEIAENYIEGEPVISKAAVMPDETNANRKIHGIGTEDTTLTEGRVTYDIRFVAIVPRTGELIRLIINLEAQGEFFLSYPGDETGGLLRLPADFGSVWHGIYTFRLSEYQESLQYLDCVKTSEKQAEYDYALSYCRREYCRKHKGTD